jgi:putative FmdB family regulatory protein
MPIYEYECLKCGAHFDKLQRLGDPAPDTCPNGHKQVHRILSQPTIIFRGSGFYVTDHPRNGKTRSAGKSGKDKGTESTPGAKTDKENTSS